MYIFLGYVVKKFTKSALIIASHVHIKKEFVPCAGKKC